MCLGSISLIKQSNLWPKLLIEITKECWCNLRVFDFWVLNLPISEINILYFSLFRVQNLWDLSTQQLSKRQADVYSAQLIYLISLSLFPFCFSLLTQIPKNFYDLLKFDLILNIIREYLHQKLCKGFIG